MARTRNAPYMAYSGDLYGRISKLLYDRRHVRILQTTLVSVDLILRPNGDVDHRSSASPIFMVWEF